MQDHRSIPLEVLREFVRTQAELSSIRTVAGAIGVGRTTLHSFLAEGGTMPHPRVRRRIALWYIAKQNEAPDIDVVRPYVSALSILVAALPEAEQETASGLLLEALEGIYAGRADIPRWLQLLLSGGVR